MAPKKMITKTGHEIIWKNQRNGLSLQKISSVMANRYIRFDWAAKRMLRDKANFVVLEGLVTVLLNEPIKIVELLESESNQENENDKFNRVDIKAKNSKGELIIVEIQQTHELYYLQRILYGVSKAVTEHISMGDNYNTVKKVYSINIIYFDLGKGSDYVYHGTTQFVGIHTGDKLQVSEKQKKALLIQEVEDIFPEYYIIRVNEFNKVATTPLEEWIAYLKTGEIKDDTTAPGLQEAKQKLIYDNMSSREQAAYRYHIDAMLAQQNALGAATRTGQIEGREEGRKEGRAETQVEYVRKMKENGATDEFIRNVTGLSDEEIDAILKQ